MKVRPLRGFALIEVDVDPVCTASGLLLGITDNTERPKMLRGTVRAVGPGEWRKDDAGRMPVDVRAGDRIWLDRKHAFAELEEREPGCPAKEILIVHTDQLQAAEC